MRDPYSVLGVGKTASEKDIKSAFRKLAKKFHPDQNPDDPKAQKSFAEINQAYEIVGDKKKRGEFDRGEIDGGGKPRGFAGGNPFGQGDGARGGQRTGGNPFGQGGQQGFGGAEDILNEFFGGAFGGAQRSAGPAGMGGMGGGAQRAQSRPSADVKVKVAVSLDDLARGKTTVTLPGGERVAASIPAGAKDGQTIRLSGKGKAGPGQQPSDVLATLVFKSHPRFKVEGSDLRADVSVPLKTSVLGGSVSFETLDGKIALKIPPWTSSGKVFRLKGRGLPSKTGHGDLMIVTVIELDKEADAELIKLMEKR